MEVSTSVTTAVAAIAPSSGTTNPVDCPARTRSMKIRLNAGVTMPAGISSRLASRIRGSARPVRWRRRSSAPSTRGGCPPGLNPGPGSKVSTIPVKPESNSSHSITRGPFAGSLTCTSVLPNDFRMPSSTMKCWNAQ